MDMVLKKASELCNSGEDFYLAVIISSDGSTPRGSGSKMIILKDSIVATIGGGLMEASVIDKARENSIECGKAEICRIDMHAKNEMPAEMICGGSCEVLIAHISCKNENMKNVFSAAYETDISNRRGWIFYIFNEETNCFECCVNTGKKNVVGIFSGNSKFSREMLENPVRVAIHGEYADSLRICVQDINPTGRMLIFGGGHVSLETAKLAANIGFDVTVVDDREEYANHERFPQCRTVVINDFNNMPDFETDDRSYILIITRGHAHDKTVLKWALKKDYFYLGMIGSKTKRDALYSSLEKEGYPIEQMRAVKCPIGLSIGAETPQEIAVSIMAEIIEETRVNK